MKCNRSPPKTRNKKTHKETTRKLTKRANLHREFLFVAVQVGLIPCNWNIVVVFVVTFGVNLDVGNGAALGSRLVGETLTTTVRIRRGALAARGRSRATLNPAVDVPADVVLIITVLAPAAGWGLEFLVRVVDTDRVRLHASRASDACALVMPTVSGVYFRVCSPRLSQPLAVGIGRPPLHARVHVILRSAIDERLNTAHVR